MKHAFRLIASMALLCFMVGSTAFSQSAIEQPVRWYSEDAMPIVTYTNYADDDTVSYTSVSLSGSNIIGTRIAQAEEAYLIAEYTDSIQADITLTFTNAMLSGLTTTYADSIVTNPATDNATTYKVITLKDGAATNRMTVYDELDIQTIQRAAGAGTTSGRYLKWMLWIKQ